MTIYQNLLHILRDKHLLKFDLSYLRDYLLKFCNIFIIIMWKINLKSNKKVNSIYLIAKSNLIVLCKTFF